MRLFPIVTAVAVGAVLYGLVLERDRVMEFAGLTPPLSAGEDAADAPLDTPATASASPEDGTVQVMAMRSVAREVDSRIVLRGQSEALREVEVRAETSGKIVSAPLRKGAFVEEGQLLCEIDPGTSEVSLLEAQARLAEAQSRLPAARAQMAQAQAQRPAARAAIAQAESEIRAAEAALAEARAGIPAAHARLDEARARVPEAEARLREAETRVPASEAARREAEARVPAAEAALAEAEARRPEAEARLAEAEARLREAEINVNAARRLSEDGFSSQVRLAGAEAALESARAQVQSATAGIKGADAAVEAAHGQVEGARAAVESAKSQVESARAGVQAARSQVENARAGIETATSQIEGAKAAEQSALARIEGGRAAVETARAQLEGAEADIESARSSEENALAGIESARAAVASAERQIERLSIVAPFAGLLESDTAEMGALMQPGAACATVIQLDPIKIVGFVPEQDVGRLDRGAPAAARVTGGDAVRGEVTFVSRSADPVTRTFRIELTVDNPDLSIRDGQTAEIAVEADGALAHLLPQSALTLDDDGTLGVRTVAEDDTALFRAVTLLRDTQTGVLVAGLPEQVDVITLGQEYVTDGVLVESSFEEVIQ